MPIVRFGQRGPAQREQGFWSRRRKVMKVGILGGDSEPRLAEETKFGLNRWLSRRDADLVAHHDAIIILRSREFAVSAATRVTHQALVCGIQQLNGSMTVNQATEKSRHGSIPDWTVDSSIPGSGRGPAVASSNNEMDGNNTCMLTWGDGSPTSTTGFLLSPLQRQARHDDCGPPSRALWTYWFDGHRVVESTRNRRLRKAGLTCLLCAGRV